MIGLGEVQHQRQHPHVDAAGRDVRPPAGVDLRPAVVQHAVLQVALLGEQAAHQAREPDRAVVAGGGRRPGRRAGVARVRERGGHAFARPPSELRRRRAPAEGRRDVRGDAAVVAVRAQLREHERPVDVRLPREGHELDARTRAGAGRQAESDREPPDSARRSRRRLRAPSGRGPDLGALAGLVLVRGLRAGPLHAAGRATCVREIAARLGAAACELDAPVSEACVGREVSTATPRPRSAPEPARPAQRSPPARRRRRRRPGRSARWPTRPAPVGPVGPVGPVVPGRSDRDGSRVVLRRASTSRRCPRPPRSPALRRREAEGQRRREAAAALPLRLRLRLLAPLVPLVPAAAPAQHGEDRLARIRRRW